MNYNYNPMFMRNYNVPAYSMQYYTPRVKNFFGNNGTPRITFSGILNGASKTLGVINQAIPVIYQVKPIISNAKTMFRVVKGINSVDKSKPNNIVTDSTKIKKEQSNAPIFFA